MVCDADVEGVHPGGSCRENEKAGEKPSGDVDSQAEQIVWNLFYGR
jgi:hypothetical protein